MAHMKWGGGVVLNYEYFLWCHHTKDHSVLGSVDCLLVDYHMRSPKPTLNDPA